MTYIHKHPFIMIIIGVMGISCSAIFVRYSQAPSSITAAYRLIWTVLLMSPVVLGMKKNRKELLKTDTKTVLICAISGIALAIHFTLWFESLKTYNCSKLYCNCLYRGDMGRSWILSVHAWTHESERRICHCNSLDRKCLYCTDRFRCRKRPFIRRHFVFAFRYCRSCLHAAWQTGAQQCFNHHVYVYCIHVLCGCVDNNIHSTGSSAYRIWSWQHYCRLIAGCVFYNSWTQYF